MEVKLLINENNVAVLSNGEHSFTLFNLLEEFLQSPENRDKLSRIEISQAIFYELALFIKEGADRDVEIDFDDSYDDLTDSD